MPTMEITRHGRMRVVERCGIPKKNVYNFVRNAFSNGLQANESKDLCVKKYVDELFVKNCTRHGGIENIVYKLYWDHAFVFKRVPNRKPTFITVFPMPDELKGAVPRHGKADRKKTKTQEAA